VARGGLRILQLDDFDLLDLLDAVWHGRDPNWHWLLIGISKAGWDPRIPWGHYITGGGDSEVGSLI